MPSPHETAYPRLKSTLTTHELDEIYTPTKAEVNLSCQVTKGPRARLGFLVLLKSFQRLGYFPRLESVSKQIIHHVAQKSELPVPPDGLEGYDEAGTRARHQSVIREVLRVQPFGSGARRVVVEAVADAAQTKNDLADLINVAIEELVRHRYELPVFGVLERAARHVRAVVARRYYRTVSARLTEPARIQFDALLEVTPTPHFSKWNQLRQDPGKATLTELKLAVDRVTWLTQENGNAAALVGLPPAKITHFAAEAAVMDAARMRLLESRKRYTLMVCLVAVQAAKALDDVAEMLIKRMLTIHQKAKEALEAYRERHQSRTDALILTLHDIVLAYRGEGSIEQRFHAIDALLGSRSQQVLADCEAHTAYAGNNYLPFLWNSYKSHRATLFRILKLIRFRSTSQDTSVEEALRFLLTKETSRVEWLPVARLIPSLDLSWIPDTWWRLVTGLRQLNQIPERINRRYFEMCVFSHLVGELKSGDLAIEGSDRFADYRGQLLSWAEVNAALPTYGEQVGLPLGKEEFVHHVRNWLDSQAASADQSFPSNHALRIENGIPILKRSEKKQPSEAATALEKAIVERLTEVNILDILIDTEHWLNWTRSFGLLSGHESKLDHPIERYLTTVFCYGCFLGPSQTARALQNVDRRSVSWINHRHITESNLDQAICLIINAYNRFALPKFWGSGHHVSADGTKWDLYEGNLLSEYHIRYGGYGGIGYYHVSDTYVALFSRFIPCGVWEAVYILDGLLGNQSDIRPDTIHADTQGQNTPVFGLAYLLGITLMPRIRNWKDLLFFRASPEVQYRHIDALFTETIDWPLIETHLPDMLRVALSIKAGKITASTLLHKLGTYSRKNRLYQAFRELGRAIRTGFLCRYVTDDSLRTLIHSAVNKSEAFNGFSQWIAFGNDGTITENNRDHQRKIIKYNHLVANCVIFHNVFTLTQILQQLKQEHFPFDEAALTSLSPYLTHHINRFGRYDLDLSRTPPAIDYEIPVLFPSKPHSISVPKPQPKQLSLWLPYES